ncbi:thaumatin family protein [Rutstroemia sp. NJR-2017a WRK4]|nr:thaumatin family protein [Rutstroemia sp. NJR-2017a WRK4]
MSSTKSPRARKSASSTPRKLLVAGFLLALLPIADASLHSRDRWKPNHDPKRPVRKGPPTKRDGSIPLVVTNMCPEPLWPGIGTQAGTGPGVGGFMLGMGETKSLTVSPDWQGRIWGRTNCSFAPGGNSASNANGNNGAGAACMTGDCGGRLDCAVTGETPVTLAEFDLAGNGGSQTFYDISLVDGYNLPMGVIYIPGENPKLQAIPPNLVNAACIATAGYLAPPATTGTNGNASTDAYPIPLESTADNDSIARWCPWDLQKTPPDKPGDGVYPYPDDNIQRPVFDPCLSSCSKTNAPKDCCTGEYDQPAKCPKTQFALVADKICPDAYGYAFDDQTSTFIVPTGGGWEIVFCPEGRSTNILKVLGDQMRELASKGVTKEIEALAGNRTYIEMMAEKTSGAVGRGRGSWAGLVLVVVGGLWLGW